MLGSPETQEAMTAAKADVDTGFSDDNSEVTVYDPISGRFNTYNTEGDPLAYNPANDLTSWGYGPSGERTLLDTSDPNYRDYVYRDQSGDKQGSLQVGQNPIDESLTGGGGGFTTGAGDRDAINRDRAGNIAADGTIIDQDPFSEDNIPIPNVGDPFAGSVNDTFGNQGGGTNAIDAGYQSGIQGNDLERFGFESSSNKDFYQRQFADMRAQQMRQDDREGQAREAAYASADAPQGEAFGGDPWSWANLPDVVEGGGGTGDPNEWLLNPLYEGKTNQEIATAVGSRFGDEQAGFYQDLLGDQGSGAQTNWANRGYDKNMADISLPESEGGFNAQNQQYMTQLFNNLYTQAGDAPTAGGMKVPAGYASPTNA